VGEGEVGTPGVGHRVCAGVYRRRQPEGSLLYRAVQENLATLREEAAEVGRGLPWYVERDFSKYLECGVLAHGFARVRCEGCNTHLHANDREGLERLCRYGARGALALERFEQTEDGRIAYRMKRPMPDGTTHLLFTGMGLLRRLASLVPPPRMNLTRFHGVFAPGAKLRPFPLPAAARPSEEEAPEAAAAGVGTYRGRQRAPRLDWAGLLRRVFKVDVFCCARGGGRRTSAATPWTTSFMT
jgi:Putative transposase